MPTQTNAPASGASVSWTSPGNVLAQDDAVATSPTGIDTPGDGLVVDFGAFGVGGGASGLSFSLTSIWQNTGSNTCVCTFWLSVNGTTKIGSGTQITLVESPYANNTQENQLGAPVPLGGGIDDAEAMSAVYVICEKTANGSGGSTKDVQIDFMQLQASWSAASGGLRGLVAIKPVTLL